jgi:uncharacterized protein
MYRVIAVILLLGDFAWWIGSDGRVRRSALGSDARRWVRIGVGLFAVFQIACGVRLMVYPFVGRHNEWWVGRALNVFAYAWHVLALPAILLGRAVADLWRWGRSKFSIFGSTVFDPEAQTRRELAAGSVQFSARGDFAGGGISRRGISRRGILQTAAVFVPPLLAGGGAAWAMGQVGRLRVRHIEIRLKALPAALDGMTIAHVGDTHVGRFSTAEMLRETVRITQSLDADLMLFTGDLIDISQGDLPPALDMARQLRGRYGAVFIEGNHDLLEDWAYDTDKFGPAVRDAGLTLLRNESTILTVRSHPVQILGLRWIRHGSRVVPMANLMKQVDPRAFAILMSHHPHAFDLSTVPLMVCGHTHGGQLMLNERLGAGPIMFRYWSGLYRRRDQALVVTNGVGNWFPIRIQAPAEITHITLRCV